MLALLQLALCEFPLMLLGFPRRGGTRTKTCRDCVFSICLWFPLLLPSLMPSPPTFPCSHFLIAVAPQHSTGWDRQEGRKGGVKMYYGPTCPTLALHCVPFLAFCFL